MKSNRKNNDNSKVNGPSIAIVLAYKDGKEYIEDQLRSIQNQSYQNLHTFIFDDKSEGIGEKQLLEKISSEYVNLSVKFRKKNVGCCSNFLDGLKEVPDSYDYFAFSDQDDIWNENKIERALERLSQFPKDKPALYCSRTAITDSSGTTSTGLSPLFSKTPSFSNALIQSIGGGNTMVMNKKARELIINFSAGQQLVAHDWWSYIVVSGSKGIIYYDPLPSLKYRQHEKNLTGANIDWLARIQRIRLLFCGRFRHWNGYNVAALDKRRIMLSEQSNYILDAFIKGRRAILPLRIFYFKKAHLYRQTLMGNLGLIIAIIFNKV